MLTKRHHEHSRHVNYIVHTRVNYKTRVENGSGTDDKRESFLTGAAQQMHSFDDTTRACSSIALFSFGFCVVFFFGEESKIYIRIAILEYLFVPLMCAGDAVPVDALSSNSRREEARS